MIDITIFVWFGLTIVFSFLMKKKRKGNYFLD